MAWNVIVSCRVGGPELGLFLGRRGRLPRVRRIRADVSREDPRFGGFLGLNSESRTPKVALDDFLISVGVNLTTR